MSKQRVNTTFNIMIYTYKIIKSQQSDNPTIPQQSQ